MDSLANADEPNRFKTFLTKWCHRTPLMSFGVTAVSALQRSPVEIMVKLIWLDPPSWDCEDTCILIFIGLKGNGNAAVRHSCTSQTFYAVREDVGLASAEYGFPPLEETLLPCQQHHTDLWVWNIADTGNDSDFKCNV